ncbi:hypothetical protein BD289DRAFT_163937 [Coniella lustricola]|uniref:PHD-type domain-containing protein n=1 Tax=Coniella lustricola TaxID=2025994 RepID=A0A2T3AEJ8_9PEZI|nr:hypothetical protein BD289DRAFT_163937 [Coniella lustricola]
MDPVTDSRFAPEAASSTEMDLDIKGEASATPDLAIKREASSGLDGDATMADIPDSAVEPRSSLPPPPPFPPADSSVADDAAQRKRLADSTEPPSSLSKPSGAARMAKKKGTASLVKKTTSRKTGKASRAGKGARGGARATASSSSRPARSKMSTSLEPGSITSSPPPATTGSSDVEGASDEEDEESDHGPYCICRGPDDHRWMISCDVCEDWFHGQCVGVEKTIGEALIVRYVCPACTDEKGVNVTRYRKTCSLEGCLNAARIYEESDSGSKGAMKNVASYSVFCSDKHADEWWEQLVRSLPENGKLRTKQADLTREKFMGLLNVSNVQQWAEDEEPWYIGKKPFVMPPDFWSTIDHTLVLTSEEQSFLSASAAERYALAEEIVLNKKMQQLLDLANERRKSAIAVGLFDKDTCGYDSRLDVVGCPVEFTVFVKSAQGEVIYKGSSLTAEGSWTEQQLQKAKMDAEANGKAFQQETACACDRRRCKPHATWYNTFTKSTRHVIKELARQAKEKLDAETRVREAAASRYFRRKHEKTTVTRLDVETD